VGAALVLISGVAATVSPVGSGVAEAAGSTAMPFDFDGDGYADLAVGVPGEDLRGRRDAGAVQVLYGSASGVTARDQFWHQGRPGVKGALEKGDGFGTELASGDFDADGYADLAIGVPFENVGSIRDAGIVQVLYGSARGLTARDQIWHQGKTGVPGSNEEGDGFGYSLAVGDFDTDGYADLVVGSPYENGQAGRAVVLRGGTAGLTASGALSLRQGRGGLPSQPDGGELFGKDLAVGDVDGDGHDDLAVVVYAEKDIPADDGLHGSAVHLLLGSPTGLTSVESQYILTSDLLVEGLRYVRFTATFGDFNRDGRADLVLASADGPVVVLHGHGDGLHVAPVSHAPMPGQDGDFGYGYGEDETAINAAAGDLTGDGYPDLVFESGVLLGTAAGLSSTRAPWVFPKAEYADVQALPLSGGSHAWLVVSNRPATMLGNAGAVTVARGTPDGNLGPVTVWSQDSPGIKGVDELYDGFGSVIGG
jgi:hypothetical protein